MERERKRILVVDDDIDQLDLFEMFLRPNYEVVLANGGEIALDLLVGSRKTTMCSFGGKGVNEELMKDFERILIAAETAFDLVITDLDMTFSGQRLIKEIKAQKLVPLIVVVSARWDIADVAVEVGADGLLAKPFGKKSLEDLIDGLFASHEKARDGSYNYEQVLNLLNATRKRMGLSNLSSEREAYLRDILVNVDAPGFSEFFARNCKHFLS